LFSILLNSFCGAERILVSKEEIHQQKIDSLTNSNTNLEGQLAELSTTIMQLVERHKASQAKQLDQGESYAALQKEHELVREVSERSEACEPCDQSVPSSVRNEIAMHGYIKY
tara:strand:- start:219 stop:557 length:339 start_codon:yes stop_codon:yes gene_type:complete